MNNSKKIVILIILILYSIHSYGQINLSIPGIVSQKTENPLFNDLIHHWNFEESSGDLLDQVGSSNGTVSGTPSRSQAGITGNSYAFDGSDDQIDISSIDLSNKSFSISFWMFNGNTNQAIRHGQGGVNQDLHTGYVASGGGSFRLDFGGSGGNGLTTSGGFGFDNRQGWQHFVSVFNADIDSVIIYHNSTEIGRNITTSNYLGNGTLSFGRAQYASSDRYSGRLDEVRIWERALTKEEVIEVYNIDN